MPQKSPDGAPRLVTIALSIALGAFACAKVDVTPVGGNTGAGGPPAGTGGAAPTPPPAYGGALPGFVAPVAACGGGKCKDFPTAPIIDMGTPTSAPDMFRAPVAGAGPCILEPEDGTLFPYNWLRPRIKWAGGGAGVYQITLHADREENDLAAYTTRDSWALPKEIWMALAANVRDEDVTVTVRAAGGGASRVKFRIAPAGASGSIVFWAATPTEVGKDPMLAADMNSELRGFTVGEEGTVSTLRLSQVKQPSRWQDWSRTRTVKCIACHVATPDGAYVAFVDHWPWNSAIAGVKPGVVGATLPGLGEGGLLALNLPWAGMPAFSLAHWMPGRRLMVVTSSLQDPRQPWSTDNRQPARLLWYNLDAPAPPEVNGQRFPIAGQQFGVIARDGDARGAACPSWSRDGKHIAYASTMGGNQDGRLEQGATDLRTIPFADGSGGASRPLAGAAESAFEEYYPGFSSDDRLVAFNRVAAGQRMYANKDAELYVVPFAGGQGGNALRMRANDPPACGGRRSPGVNNHFAKWAPAVPIVDGKSYYWFIFSSNRAEIAPVRSNYFGGSTVQVSQLYMSAVVVSGNTADTYPAIYLWNQSPATVNTTPVWESLEIPRVIE